MSRRARRTVDIDALDVLDELLAHAVLVVARREVVENALASLILDRELERGEALRDVRAFVLLTVQNRVPELAPRALVRLAVEVPRRDHRRAVALVARQRVGERRRFDLSLSHFWNAESPAIMK